MMKEFPQQIEPSSSKDLLEMQPYKEVSAFFTEQNDMPFPFSEKDYCAIGSDAAVDRALDEYMYRLNDGTNTSVNKTEEINDGRRVFLKRAGAIAAGGTAAAIIGVNVLKSRKDQNTTGSNHSIDDVNSQNNTLNTSIEEDHKFKEGSVEEFIEDDGSYQFDDTLEQIEMRNASDATIGDTIGEQLREKDHVTIDQETRNAMRAKWRTSYSPKTNDFRGKDNFEGSLLPAMERIQPWLPAMRAEFRKIGVPEDFVYLSIPESHFQLNAVSPPPDNATGPFQFIAKTAKNYDLIMENGYDERRDPVKSAAACARHLRESYERFGKNWSLALADYNGGYTNKFLKHIGKLEQEAELKVRRKHTVKNGDNFYKIAHKYNASLLQLLRINDRNKKDINESKEERGKRVTVNPGVEILIPQEKRKIESAEFFTWLEEKINKSLKESNGKSYSEKMSILSDYRQNLEYPEKLYAIFDVITEFSLREKYPPIDNNFQEVSVPKVSSEQRTYIIKSGDTLSEITKDIAKKSAHILSPREILQRIRNNPRNDVEHDRIKIGQKLVIDVPTSRPASLKDFSQKYNIPLSSLKKLNPAILKNNTPLPDGISLRIPQSA